MISSIVKLLIAFPKLAELFLKIKKEYVKEVLSERHNKHGTIIKCWVHDDKG